MNRRVTIVDIQHKTFKRALQGYDRADVDRFLDDVIETLEEDASARARLELEVADLRERITHFKSMEESLQNTLLLAQRTADEVKASAHKEADLIRAEARVGITKEQSSFEDRTAQARREYQRAIEMAEKAKAELRSLLTTHLAILDRSAELAIGPAEGPLPQLGTTGPSTGGTIRTSDTRRLPIVGGVAPSR